MIKAFCIALFLMNLCAKPGFIFLIKQCDTDTQNVLFAFLLPGICNDTKLKLEIYN